MRRYTKIHGQILSVLLLNIGAALVLLVILGAIGMRKTYQLAVGENARLGAMTAADNRARLIAQARGNLQATARNKARIVSEKLAYVQEQTRVLAELLTRIYSAPDNFPPRQIENSAAGAPNIYAVAAPDCKLENFRDEISLAANALDLMRQVIVNRRASISEIGSENGFMLAVEWQKLPASASAFDPRVRGWYRGAANSGGLFWSDIYQGWTHGALINCASPFYAERDGQKILKGVAAHALEVSVHIQQILDAGKITPNSYLFLVNQYGNVIGDSQSSGQIRDALARDAVGLRWGENITKERLDETVFDGKSALIAFCPLDILPWRLGIVAPMAELGAPAESLAQKIAALVAEKQAQLKDTFAQFAQLLLIMVLLVILTTALAGELLSRRLTAQLAALARAAQIIAAGNLTHPLTAATRDTEIVSLVEALRTMVGNVRRMTAENEYRAAEILTAEKIHAEMLPEAPEKFGARFNLEFAAVWRRGENTATSIYDFFAAGEPPDAQAAFLVASVYGKRVAGALLLTALKTLIRSYVSRRTPLMEIFTAVNREMCANGDAGMYVVATFGLLDIAVGKFTLVSAGAPPPICRREKTFYPLPMRSAVALGITANAEYNPIEITITRDEIWFFHTAGDDMRRRDADFAEKLTAAAVDQVAAGLAVFERENSPQTNLAVIGLRR